MENKRNWRRRIAGLAIGLALCLGAGNISAAASGSSAVTSDSIKAKEAEISQKKKEKEGLKDGLSDLQQIKKLSLIHI